MKKETATKLIGEIVKPIKKDLVSWEDILAQYKKSYIKKDSNTTISICQNKGGVGKTTSTINLGWLFSQLGKTLLIDLDPQANLSKTFSISITDEPSLKEFIDNKDSTAIYNVSNNLDIIPNTKSFEDWKKHLITKRNPSYLLSKALKDLKKTYDFILIDCPPSMDISFDLAFYSSNYALILMDGDAYSMDGLENILEEIQKVKDEDVSNGSDLEVLGIVFNAYKSTNLMNTIIDKAKENYFIFNTKIRENVAIPESQVMKTNVFNYNETSNGSVDFFNLFQEIMVKI